MEELAEYFESLSSVADLSAVEQMVDGKRDYDDLTYNFTSYPTTFELSSCGDQWTGDTYQTQRMKWQVARQGVEDDYVETLSASTQWSRWQDSTSQYPHTSIAFNIGQVDQWGQPVPEQDGMFYFFDNDYIGGFAFDLQDNLDHQTITRTIDTYHQSNVTYVITFNFDDPSATISTDSLVLSSELSSYVPSSDFSLSGLGCTTLNLSGTYEDETTFSYDFVVKEANQ